MTKTELIAEIADKAKLTKADSERALEACIEIVKDALKQGDEVKLVGFGTFGISERKATMGRNPKTSEPISIPARRIPRFKPGKQLKDAVEKKKSR